MRRRRGGGAGARAASAIVAVAAAAAAVLLVLPALAAAALEPSPLLQRSVDPAEARRRARPIFPGWNVNGGDSGSSRISNNNSNRNTSPAATLAGAVVVPASVCGDNSLTPADDPSFCQIVSTWYTATTRKPVYFFCSAFVIGRKMLGTAGHCVYAPKNATAVPAGDDGDDDASAGPPELLLTRYPATIDVYCAGADGRCAVDESTTYGLRALTTRRYTRSSGAPSAWDVAVVSVNDDLVAATAKPAVALGQFSSSRSRPLEARLVGYPFQNEESEACNTPEYSGGCAQYSSEGTVDAKPVATGDLKGMLTSSSLDLCQGHSGSAVLDASSNKAVAVVSGYIIGGCLNLFAPLVSAANADRTTCERARGGVSIDCLRRALERRGSKLSGP